MHSWIRRLPALALLAVAPLAAETRSLTILHLNDLHAHLTPLQNSRGGFAYLATLIREQRANCQDCILLYGGDLVQGTPVSTIFHGLPIYEIANLFGFDAATLGNHEFDYGWPQTQKFIQTAHFPIVCSNVVGADGQLLTPKPYVILKVNGLRVAVIGALTNDLPTLTTPKLLGEWHTAPLVATVRKYADELRDQSDLIVLLAHINAKEEKAVLSQAPEIPVVVSGHVHFGLDQPITEDGRLVVRTKSYGEELGRLNLKVDTATKSVVSWNWQKIPIDSREIQPAPDVAREVKRWEDQVSARVDQPLAVSKRAFTREEVRDLMEKIMCEETGADFAFMNLGGVRDTLPKGQLLVRNIWNIMPFDNELVFGKMKGRDLPPVVLNGRQVDPDREYTLAVSDFTASNQSAPDQLRSKGLEFPGNGGLLRDALIDWFRKKKVIE
ncbi:MAG TPA: bifunctional UDP-sugar hydrolase/5'-nucleotidase [Bryobacteraceae bacterium]|nr:bifunctional UDP-sugar hydrolase/5'-nucleotidase [Bryobacteraceae bacterium]